MLIWFRTAKPRCRARLRGMLERRVDDREERHGAVGDDVAEADLDAGESPGLVPEAELEARAGVADVHEADLRAVHFAGARRGVEVEADVHGADLETVERVGARGKGELPAAGASAQSADLDAMDDASYYRLTMN